MDNPRRDEQNSSEPWPDQSNQPTDFRYDCNLAASSVGVDHVSQQYHLMSAVVRTAGIPVILLSVNFDDGFHHALLSEYIDLRYSPTYATIDSGCARAIWDSGLLSTVWFVLRARITEKHPRSVFLLKHHRADSLLQTVNSPTNVRSLWFTFRMTRRPLADFDWN